MSPVSKIVLIIDDDPIYRTLMREFLTSKAAIEALEAANGAEACRLVAATPGIALILCDLNMPDMNGVELMQRLIDVKSSIPLLIVTGALASTVTGADALARINGLNVIGVCRKPVDHQAVWEFARPILGR